METLCLCPTCGEKIKSKDLLFDFTKFISIIIKKMIVKDGENKEVSYECDTFFNNCAFYESEERLCSLPEPENQKGFSNMHVEYRLPYEKLIEVIGSNKNFKNFKEWLEKRRESIVSKKYILLLQKDGDNVDDRVRIDKVLLKDEEESIDYVAKGRKCPRCHGLMSYWAGRYDEICLTVLGGPRVSKSTTMTACIHAFMEKNGSICLETRNEETWNFFQKNYLEPYENGKKTIPTDTQEDKIPRVSFRVVINGRSIILTFIDLPGEFNGEKGIDINIYRKYENFYKNIDFVWYCTDPGEVQQLKGEAKKILGYEENKDILSTDTLISNMKTLSSFFNRAGRKIPVIYILGKSDAMAISDQDKADFGLYQTKEYDTYEPLNIEEFYEQARKTKAYIEKYNPQIVRTFEECFSNRAYMAMSAYGYAPENDKTKEDKKPYHCRLPLYWMLALRNCIEVSLTFKKGRRKQEYVGKLKDLEPQVRENAEYNLYMRGPYKI